jgi:hypothetical protein
VGILTGIGVLVAFAAMASFTYVANEQGMAAAQQSLVANQERQLAEEQKQLAERARSELEKTAAQLETTTQALATARPKKSGQIIPKNRCRTTIAEADSRNASGTAP